MGEQVLENFRWVQVAWATDGRVLGQLLVHLVAQEVVDVQAQGTVLHEAPLTEDVLRRRLT